MIQSETISLEGEIWRPVVGYEGIYEVSNKGRVKSLIRGKGILKPSRHPNGYMSVELFRGKEPKSKRKTIHRLVAMAFIPNPNNLPFVNHRDESRDNNCVENLEWITHRDNLMYGTAPQRRMAHIDYTDPKRAEIARINGKAVSKPVDQFTRSGEFIQSFESAKAASIATGTSHSHLLECCMGKLETSGGYIWKYKRKE